MDKRIIGLMTTLLLVAFVVGLNINDSESIVTPMGVADKAGITGFPCVSLKRAGSNEWSIPECKENTVVEGGFDMVKNSLGEGGINAITNLTLGAGVVPSGSDTALDVIYSEFGLAGATGAYNTNGIGNWSISYTFTCTAADKVVNTTGLYKDGGALFAGTEFTTTTLQANDKILVNYTLWVS